MTIPMSDLIVVGFEDRNAAERVRYKLIQMQRNHLVDLKDAVVAVKGDDGKIKLHQTHHLTVQGAVQGAVTGTFFGLLIGLIFMSPFLVAAAGATAGTITGALADVGIDDRFMKELSETLRPGSSALFILAHEASTDKVIEELRPFEGRVIQTSLNHEDEKALQAALESARQA